MEESLLIVGHLRRWAFVEAIKKCGVHGHLLFKKEIPTVRQAEYQGMFWIRILSVFITGGDEKTEVVCL